MRVFAAFLALLAVCLILSAVFFYPTALGAGPLFDLAPHKVLTRLAKLIAALCFVFFLKKLDIWDRILLGYGTPRREFVREMLKGWGIGVAIMLVPVISLVALDIRLVNDTPPGFFQLVSLALGALASGLAIGFIEETFFRGALYGGMRRTTGIWTAAIVSALFYAMMHFIRPSALQDGELLGWTSGFPLLWSALEPFGTTGIWDSFVALTGAGILLALIREHRGNIALAVGVHAGWVMVIRFTKKLTWHPPESANAWLVGSYDQIIGWLAVGWLLVLIIGYLAYRSFRNRQPVAA